MTWWVYDYIHAGAYTQLVSVIFWVLFSITLHELAHGWAALWQGDDTPIRSGHMTLNPVVHLGWMSLVMFALVGIAWGQMPVDPSRFRWRRKGRIVVWGAGPAMNVLLAIVALTGCALWMRYVGNVKPNIYRNIEMFLFTGGWLNIALALFNLLPVPPLDGAGILAGLSFRFYRWMQNPQFQQIAFFVFLLLFMSGIGGLLFVAAQRIAMEYVVLVMRVLPGAMP